MERFRDTQRLGLSAKSRGVVVADVDAGVDLLADILKEELGLKAVEELWTESDFRAQLSRWSADTPELFLVGCGFPWGYPDPETPTAPPEVQARGAYYNAGARCLQLLEQNGVLKRSKALFYCHSGSDHCDIPIEHPNVYGLRDNDHGALQILYKPFLGK